MIRRRDFLALVGAGLASASLRGVFGQSAPAGPSKPNVIIIVADDLGYADVGCHGCADIATPNIDSIGKNGVRFTDGYVSAPLCSPTRAGIMTGRYQQRFGHEFNPGPVAAADENFGLPLTESTLADQLKAAGYATGMVGKWHLGYEAAYHPLKRGFDEFFGFLGGAHPYADGKARKGDILRGVDAVAEKEYLTDAFTREAVAYIDRHKQHPFFLYLTYNAVHNPMDEPPKKYMDRVGGIKDEKRRTFAGMLTALDEGVGAVLSKLREAGIEKDTLLFFISDNGGPTSQTTSSNAPLRGYKGGMLEGGIRIPFMVQWPRRLPAGVVYRQPVISLDMFATAIGAAGARPPREPLDGVDLTGFVSGENKSAPHEMLYWRMGGQSAVRKGNWKLVKLNNRSAELYDLANDIGEAKNLLADKPDIARELSEALARWDKQLSEPKWGRAGRKAGATSRPAGKGGRRRGS